MSGTGVVEAYLAAIAAHDWDTVRALVTEDVVRIGPYGDVYRGRDAYVDYLAELMPALRGYRMDISAVTYVADRAFAELSETVRVDDQAVVTPEVLICTVRGRQLCRVEVFIRRAEA